MRRHPAMLKKAGITPGRYKELKGFCEQWRDYARACGSGGSARDGWARRRMAMIRQSAASVTFDPPVADAIIASVTAGRSYAAIAPPMGPRQFQELRLLFFIDLDMRLREMGQ